MAAIALAGAGQPDIDKGPSILAVCSTMTMIALVVVCSRLWVRVKMIGSVGIDDYVITIAMGLSLTGLGIIIPEVQNGAGRHVAYLDPDKVVTGLKLNFASQPIYLWAITVVKISIAFFLLRIAPNKFYTKGLWAMIIFLTTYTTVCFMTIMLQCTNVAILWDPVIKATCWRPETLRFLSYLNSSLNIATDLLFAILPVPMLWKVQIKGRVKASLICVLGLGVFACAASIVKMSYVSNYGKTGDFLWDSTNITIWTVTECNTGIIASSLPCLKPLFRHLLEKSLPGYASTASKNNHHLRTLRQSTIPDAKTPKSFSSAYITSKSTGIQRRDLEEHSSEENILIQGNSIVKTTVVTVEDFGVAISRDGSTWSKKNDLAPTRAIEDKL